MPHLEHPDIAKMNRDGHLGFGVTETAIETCSHCESIIPFGKSAVEFHDRTFCDEECLTESFCQSPAQYGAETKIID